MSKDLTIISRHRGDSRWAEESAVTAHVRGRSSEPLRNTDRHWHNLCARHWQTKWIFCAQENIAFERYVFRQSKQEDDETVDNFIVKLSKLSISCDFSELQKEDMIRDQVVDCCRSTALRKKLLSESDLTLEKVRTTLYFKNLWTIFDAR